MSLYEGIQRFLAGVDPVILSRGQGYFRGGNVENIEREGDHITAEVCGSEADPYLVDIGFDEDGEIEVWDCDCPYDWGPVCKHTVAALLAIQAEQPEEQRENTGNAAIQALVEQAEKSQLIALILAHCREDQRFQNQVLSVLEDSGELELASIKELVRTSLSTHKGYGDIDARDCDAICKDLDDALDKARHRIERGQHDQAFEIAQFILLTGLRLLEEVDCSFDPLWRTIYNAIELIELGAKHLAESGKERGEWVRKLLSIAQDPAFDGWEDQRFDFLERITVLADAQNESEFYHALDHLSDRRWERFADSRQRTEQEELVRYHIVQTIHGQAAAQAYLEDHVGVDRFRLMLIQEHMEAGRYADAKRLCQERIAKESPERPSRISRWQYLLYEIYQGQGQRERQIEQARKLALWGDMEFYKTTKTLLTEAGQWQDAYPHFLEELKAALPARRYMEILAQEKETVLLMEHVRVYRDTVFQYGGILVSRYSKEIYGMYSAVIRQATKRINGRNDYHGLSELLCSLVDLGGITEARALLNEIYQTYPRRPALRDELDRVERRIREKAMVGGAASGCKAKAWRYDQK